MGWCRSRTPRCSLPKTRALPARDAWTDAEQFADFQRDGEIDFSHTVTGLARYRVNAFRQRGSTSIVFRVVPFAIRSIPELELPAVIGRLADAERGLILVTGTTGSGKSTTLAAMVDHINTSYAKNIVTIEDPIEYLLKDLVMVERQDRGERQGRPENRLDRLWKKRPADLDRILQCRI